MCSWPGRPLTGRRAAPPSLPMQLRSLDISQNVFEDEYGDELRVLSQLTSLECLKLANCRMLQAGRARGLALPALHGLHLFKSCACPCAAAACLALPLVQAPPLPATGAGPSWRFRA